MRKNIAAYFSKNLLVVLGVVLIWRGIWHILDFLDVAIFAGNGLWTSVGGIIVGLLVLYLPDGDLKELKQL
jgi:hypothetical protein